jgi:hypothetical protein
MLQINTFSTGLSVEVDNDHSPGHSLDLIHTILFQEMASVSKHPSVKITTDQETLSTDLVIVVSPGDVTCLDVPPLDESEPQVDPNSAPQLQFSFIFGCFPAHPETERESEELSFQFDLKKATVSDLQLSGSGGIGEGDYSEEWLAALITAQAFCLIPSPVQNLLAPVSLHGGNSKTSHGQYVCSSDVVILIRSMESYHKQIPSLQPFVNEIQNLFHVLSQVQCNRDAACCFGHRLEEIIRFIANPRQGILRLALVSYYGTLQSHLHTLTTKLIEIKGFIHSLTTSGWLSLVFNGHVTQQRNPFNRLFASNSSSSPSGSPPSDGSGSPYLRMKYEDYDRDLMIIMNRILRDFPQITWTEFETSYSYDMILDVMDTIETYGGVKNIKTDRSKIKAVSRLIQCHEVELEAELRHIAPSMKRKLCQNLFCCFHSSGTVTNTIQNKRESYDETMTRSDHGRSHSTPQKKTQSKRAVSADLSEGLLSDTSSYGAKAGDVDFFQPSLREAEEHQQKENS